MFCGNCGKQNPNQTRNCIHCGAPLTVSFPQQKRQQQQQPLKKNNKALVLILGLSAIVLLLVALVIIVWQSGRAQGELDAQEQLSHSERKDLPAEKEIAAEVLPSMEQDDEASPAPPVATTPEDETNLLSIPTIENGKLVLATNAQFPPYEYYEGDRIVGIDIEIATELANRLGLELVIEDMEFDAIVSAVNSGRADIGMAGMTVTPERMDVVAFTDPYYTATQVVLVPKDSEITGSSDLFAGDRNYIIGVQRNTTADLYSTWDLEDGGLATVDRYSKGADAIQALLTGRVNCVIMAQTSALTAMEENSSLISYEYITESYAAGINKNNPDLYNAVCNTLEEMTDDGTIQHIVEKYIYY